MKCKKRFTTYEQMQFTDLYVIKKDKRRELFSREKLMRGLERAFEKRPISQETIQQMANSIEEALRKKGKEVKSSAIGEIVMKKLAKADTVAYIRFASVYKEFQDPKDFSTILKNKNRKVKGV